MWYRRFFDRLADALQGITDAIRDFGTVATEVTDEILSPGQRRKRRRAERRQVRRAQRERAREERGKRPTRRQRRAARRAPPPPLRPAPVRGGEPYILLTLDRYGEFLSNESSVRYDFERVAYMTEEPGHSTCESLIDAGVPPSIMAYVYWLDGRNLPYVVYVGYPG